MKKLLPTLLLAIIALLVLYGFSGKSENIDYTYYFRDNKTLSGHIAVWTEDDVTWAKYSAYVDEYIQEGLIPQIYGFTSLDCWVRYNEDGLYALQFDWTTPHQENDQSLTAYLYPQEPDKYEKVDGMFNLDYEHVTVTEQNGIAVYGDGTPESTYQILELILKDGTYCQIVSRSAISPSPDSLGAMKVLLDHLITHGIDLDQIYPHHSTSQS